jgi:hypothetical protein
MDRDHELSALKLQQEQEIMRRKIDKAIQHHQIL